MKWGADIGVIPFVAPNNGECGINLYTSIYYYIRIIALSQLHGNKGLNTNLTPYTGCKAVHYNLLSSFLSQFIIFHLFILF